MIVNSRNNRNFTTTEEADICCYAYEGLKIEFFENMAWFTMEDRIGVQIFAISDNEYLVHQETACDIYITDSLQDAMDDAVEVLLTTS
jgi:hypothetical protein